VSDAIERTGLEMARLSSQSEKAIREYLPPAAATGNPVDVLGDGDALRYEAVLEIVRADPAVDAIIAMLTPQRVTQPEQTARVISYLAREQVKPVIAVFMGGEAVGRGRALLDEARVPVYAYPERAIRALAALVRYGEYRRSLGSGS
jgi:acetyltransferase